jgi:hypothetical protein
MGWTPTHFVRQATLEKAAHVENTSTPTSFDFDRLARRLATQLCEPAVMIGHDSEPESGLASLDAFLDSLPNDFAKGFFSRFDPSPLKLSDVELIRKAGRLGGAEFLNKLLDECERLVAHQRTDLPPPVDPSQLGDGE